MMLCLLITKCKLRFAWIILLLWVILLIISAHVFFKEMSSVNLVDFRVNTSTCSVEALKRGMHQKVVSFCYYRSMCINETRNYFEGIEINAALMRTLYPGWVMRVYHNVTKNEENILSHMSKLSSHFRHLDFCNVTDIPAAPLRNMHHRVIPTIWRFFAMADPQVDVLMCRDLDSHVSLREKKAVDEWLRSSLTMHVMRDHPSHHTNMLAGMWGVKVFQDRRLFSNIVGKIFTFIYADYHPDQNFLEYVLWPHMKGDILQHDSYYCLFPLVIFHGNVRPWPTRREQDTEENFVGYNPLAGPLNITCPEKCRPKHHRDWLLC